MSEKIEAGPLEAATFCTNLNLMLFWQLLTQACFRMVRN